MGGGRPGLTYGGRTGRGAVPRAPGGGRPGLGPNGGPGGAAADTGGSAGLPGGPPRCPVTALLVGGNPGLTARSANSGDNCDGGGGD